MKYHVVVVDDEPLSLTNARNILSEEGMKVSCLRSGEDLLCFLTKNSPDLILLDILMPEMDGFETYRALREYEEKTERNKTPVVFLSGDDSSESERKGLKAGASDFICKPFDKVILVNRVNNIITNSKMIESLTEEVALDGLTGFLNKTSSVERICKCCEDSSGALMVFDLDNFKLVNDLYGHDMGDMVLVEFAKIIKNNIREGDVIGRIGGDEFIGFFPKVFTEGAVSTLNTRLNEQIKEMSFELMGNDHGIPLGISLGVSFVPLHSRDYHLLFHYADESLYKVKQNGKHGYKLYEPPVNDMIPDEDMDSEIIRISRIIKERGEGKGAQLLGQDAFSWNYRFIIRFVKRYGGEVCRIMFSLHTDIDSAALADTMNEFGNVLKTYLRKSDIFYQCKPNCYFVVLPLLSEENIEVVTKRIMDAWEQHKYSAVAKVKHVALMLKVEDDK